MLIRLPACMIRDREQLLAVGIRQPSCWEEKTKRRMQSLRRSSCIYESLRIWCSCIASI